MDDQSALVMTETLSILLIMAGLCILPLIMFAGFALLRRFEHAPHRRDAAVTREMDQLEKRITGLETSYRELTEMQERLDFLEAVLEAEPSRAQLPGAGEPDGMRTTSR